MTNPFSLKGKRVLITGATGGIGSQTALVCSSMGSDVILTGRNLERLEKLRDMVCEGDINSHCAAVKCDLSNDSDIVKLVSELDPLDGLVLCAGRNDKALMKFIKRENIEEMFNTNVFSDIILCKELLKRKKLNRGASIVFISSISSVYATISNTLYAGTKGAINSIIRVLALELANNKIRVNGIMPGMINTSMINVYGLSSQELQNVISQYPLGRIGEASDVANAVVYLLSDASSWVTGINIVVDGGVTLR